MKKPINLTIKGFIDVSFVDWDSKLASVIFLPNCNFRCPFCHNVNLVLHPEKLETIPFEFVKDQLETQRGWTDGVCITGGEPTLHTSLPELCSRLKKMGFLVKVDTNGTNPSMLKELMDIRELLEGQGSEKRAPSATQEVER